MLLILLLKFPEPENVISLGGTASCVCDKAEIFVALSKSVEKSG